MYSMHTKHSTQSTYSFHSSQSKYTYVTGMLNTQEGYKKDGEDI